MILHARNYDHIIADGTKFYRKKNQPVTIDEITRHILFVRPDYFVLIDNIIATEHKSYEWVCHFGDNVSVSGDWIRGNSTNNQILGIRVVSPNGWTYTTGA